MAAFASTDELGEFLGETLTGARLAQAALVIELVSADIQSWTGQTLEFVEDDTITLKGTSDWELELPERPVVSVGDVTVDGQLVDPSMYRLADSALVRVGGWIGSKDSVVQVVYSHGYDPIPDVIRGVTLQLAARMMSNPLGVRQEGIGTYNVTYAGDVASGEMPPSLRRFRRTVGTTRIGLDRYGRPIPVANQ